MESSGYVMSGDIQKGSVLLTPRGVRRRSGVGASGGAILPGTYSPASDLTAKTPGQTPTSSVSSLLSRTYSAPTTYKKDEGPGILDTIGGGITSFFGGVAKGAGALVEGATSILGAAAPALPSLIDLFDKKGAKLRAQAQMESARAQAEAAKAQTTQMMFLGVGVLGVGAALYFMSQKKGSRRSPARRRRSR